MTFKLNTKSGMLHLEGHGGDASVETFDRADAADKFAHKAGTRMKFCSICFPSNPNSEDEAETPSASPSEFTTAAGTLPASLTTGTSSTTTT